MKTKEPPQAVELEKDVLGALMVESKSIDKIPFLTPEMFYDTKNRLIFESILDLNNEGNPIDIHTVSEQLKKNGTLEKVGGLYTLAELTAVCSASHIVYHAEIINQKFISRQLITLSTEIAEKSFDETNDVSDVLSELEKRFTEIVI